MNGAIKREYGSSIPPAAAMQSGVREGGSGTARKARRWRAFALLLGVSTFPFGVLSRPNCRKSPAFAGNIPVFRRLWLEIWFDPYCRRGWQCEKARVNSGVIRLGGGDQVPRPEAPDSLEFEKLTTKVLLNLKIRSILLLHRAFPATTLPATMVGAFCYRLPDEAEIRGQRLDFVRVQCPRNDRHRRPRG
jgi:hypothetical protein